MIKLTKEEFTRFMKEAYDLGRNDGYEVNFNELINAYMRDLEGYNEMP